MVMPVIQQVGTQSKELDAYTDRNISSTCSGIVTTYRVLVSDTGVIIPTQPVQVEGNAIRFYPHMMARNKFYSVVLNNRPYAYRRNDEDEIEVYGLAEKSK